ncbi:MAG: GNAT family N-acetyltransferase [Nocardioides sp.]
MTALEFFTDPGDFLRAAGEHLAADPVLSTVVAAVTERMRDEIAAGVPQDASYPRWWLVVRDGAGTVCGVAMRTAPFRPHPLYVMPMPDEAARDLARVMHARGEAAPGINGALPAARICAEETSRLTGGTVSVGAHTRLFELGDLVSPASPLGGLRPAVEDDAELALAWFEAFGLDADEQAGREPGSMHETADDRASMLRRIAGARIWFWVDETGERVHLTGANLPAYGVARIGPVYTPREQRGRGYASAAVAEVSRLIVAGGARACLFTDQANPTSNKIYEALGYRRVVDMANLLVTQHEL